MNKFVDRLVNSRAFKGFFDQPLEGQVKSIIKWSFILSAVVALIVITLSVGLNRVGGFVLLVLLCAPFSMLFGLIKSRAVNRFKSKDEGGMTFDDDTI